MSGQRVYVARRIGHAAASLIRREAAGSLRGHTSKGVYIQTETRWILFLSFGKAVGPLSITLEQDVRALDDLPPGAVVEIRDGRLVFPTEDVAVDAQQAEVWTVPAVPAPASGPQEQVQRVHALARQAVAVKQGLGLSFLLPYLLWPEAVAPAMLPAGEATMLDGVQTVSAGLISGGHSQVLQGAQILLGRGRGLTPAGDDFFLGLLLACRRWAVGLSLSVDMERFAQELVSLSYEKTTALSGNLIECAARGEADERLLALVDSIFCGIPSVAASARPMLTWGYSSGVDVMTGIAVAVLAAAERSPGAARGLPS